MLLLSPVDEDEVSCIVSSFKKSKACGPASIPTSILKNYIDVLVAPITYIINLSFLEGTFPNILKLANVCPIYKKNEKDLCENYRPISLLSNISKVIERAMHTRIFEFLNTSDVFYDLQFGFRKKYSTNHALLSIVEGIRNSLNEQTFSCGVFIDLEKAFDTVNHRILLGKLDHYGIRGISNSWFSSYLSNRKQNVILDGTSSSYLDVVCGVPQGSILGPLLFLLYVNDMNKAVKYSLVHHFADDTNLLCSDKNPKTLRKKVNEDLRLIFDWLCANRLSLNVGKTEFIIFKPPRTKLQERITLKLNRVTLYESTKIKYLGIIMDDRLTWKHHIFELSKKLNRAVGIIYKMKKMHSPKSVQLSLYYSLFHSNLNYGISIWGDADATYVNKIKIAQKKVIRIIADADFLAHTDPLFKEHKILKFDDVYLHQYASLMWDQDHRNLPQCFEGYFKKVSSVHDHETRQAYDKKLTEINYRTITHGKKLFKFKGPKILNQLKSLDFYREAETKLIFRKRYKAYLLNKY